MWFNTYIGGHVLSGNVFEPRSMDELLPERWRTEFDGKTDVTSDSFLMLLDEERSFRLPDMALPSALHNEGNFVISLGKLVRYLGDVAEELGVEVRAKYFEDLLLAFPLMFVIAMSIPISRKLE